MELNEDETDFQTESAKSVFIVKTDLHSFGKNVGYSFSLSKSPIVKSPTLSFLAYLQ